MGRDEEEKEDGTECSTEHTDFSKNSEVKPTFSAQNVVNSDPENADNSQANTIKEQNEENVSKYGLDSHTEQEITEHATDVEEDEYSSNEETTSITNHTSTFETSQEITATAHFNEEQANAEYPTEFKKEKEVAKFSA